MGNAPFKCSVDRPPESSSEAYVAGLIATDGHVRFKAGIEIKMCDRATLLFEKLSAEFQVPFQRVPPYGNRNPQVRIRFRGMPAEWKHSVPLLKQGFHRHYLRGLVDGDGSITHHSTVRPHKTHVYLNVDFYHALKEQWLGDYWVRAMECLGLHPRVYKNRETVAKISIARHREAVLLARYLYYDADLALPLKRIKALSPRTTH